MASKIYLPLLFADGQPTSLERITASQLERFIPFMLTCCPENTSEAPVWWPSAVPYQFPLSPICSPTQWLNTLKQIVCRCYEYHNCEHVLRFCLRLAELSPGYVRYKESSQGYMSIYSKDSNKLIVTFKKKNQIYDRPSASPFKSLLPPKPRGPPSDQHVQHIEDIYLCNYCDEEFTSFKDAISHEGVCEGKIDQEIQNNEELDQASVMRYFELGPAEATKKESRRADRCTSVRLTARSYLSIPISSPLGLKMGANITHLSNENLMDCIQKIEAHCCSIPSCRPRRFGISRRRKYSDDWTHTYCFNRAQRIERRITLKTGLNKHSRLLLQKCKKAIVLIERLPLLDPLALHAAATLNFPKEERRDYESRNAIPDPTPTCYIDVTRYEVVDCDNGSLKENCTYSEGLADSFFNSSSNHKRLPLRNWGPPYPRSSLPPIALPFASV